MHTASLKIHLGNQVKGAVPTNPTPATLLALQEIKTLQVKQASQEIKRLKFTISACHQRHAERKETET